MLCRECKALVAAKIRAIRHYRDLMAARRSVLEEGCLISPLLGSAIVRAETALNDVLKKLNEHRFTHGSSRQSPRIAAQR